MRIVIRMSPISKDVINAMRDLMGKLSRSFSKNGNSFNSPSNDYFVSPPNKIRKPDGSIHETPPQISGVRGLKTNDIPGTKAGGNKIAGGLEAGGKAPLA